MAIRSRFGAALALSLAVTAAVAQPASSDRPWVDPPARSAAPAPKATDAPIAEAAKSPGASPKRETGAAAPAQRRVASHARRPKAVAAHAAPRPRVATRSAPIVRTVSVRRFHRYGYAAPQRGRWRAAYEDDRGFRIRRAREAGYLVVRQHTLAFPDGRRIQTYRPYEPLDDDD